MKNIIKYLGWTLLGMTLVSCHKNDDVIPVYPENRYRVKEIAGHHALWGDFKMSLQYEDNRFEKGIVVNSQNDTVGKLDRMFISRTNLDIFRVSVKQVALTPEEIAALPEGSDIPTTWSTVYQIDRNLKKEVISRYDYQEGELHPLPQRTYLYEYEDSLALNPKVLIWRGYEGQDNEGGLERMVYHYDGERIRMGEYAEYHTDWEIVSRYTYEYQNDRILSLTGKTTGGETVLDKKFIYEGSRLKVITIAGNESREATYTLNAEGYVTRIEEGEGNYMNITYENGHGDFSNFIPLADKLQGEPYIK